MDKRLQGNFKLFYYLRVISIRGTKYFKNLLNLVTEIREAVKYHQGSIRQGTDA